MTKLLAAFCALLLLASVCLAADKAVSDDKIWDEVSIKLTNDPVVKGGALKVDVKEGVVTLGGTVETNKQKDRASGLAKKIKGVKQVVNNIVVKTGAGK